MLVLLFSPVHKMLLYKLQVKANINSRVLRKVMTSFLQFRYKELDQIACCIFVKTEPQCGQSVLFISLLL